MGIWQKFKQRLFVGKGVTTGRNFHLGLFSWVSASDRLVIGDHVYIGKLCTIQCNGSIGDGVLIGNNVGIVGRLDHDFRQVGTLVREAGWIGDSEALRTNPRNAVTIGEDVWIGFGSTILSGVNIGRGAIIGAGSVVRNDVAPYDIVTGNPAAPVARRFTEEQITVHEAGIANRLLQR